jgi:translation initiation factor 2D
MQLLNITHHCSSCTLSPIAGADVMLPGVDSSCLPEFQKGDLLAVCVPGNPAPIAIGAAAMHSMAAGQQAAGQGKGKLVEVMQHYGDTLWQSLGRCAAPNDGFLQGVVAPEGAAAAAAAEGDTADDAAALMQQLGLDGAAAADSRQTAAGAAGAGDSGSSEAVAAAGGSSSPWPDDMDQLMELALLQVSSSSCASCLLHAVPLLLLNAAECGAACVAADATYCCKHHAGIFLWLALC